MKVSITLDSVDMCIVGDYQKQLFPSAEEPGQPESFEPHWIYSFGSLSRDDDDDKKAIMMVEDILLNSRYDEISKKCLEAIHAE